MKKLKKEIKVTNHFVERYYERVFKKTPPKMSGRTMEFKIRKIIAVLNDLEQNISSRDLNNLLFLKNCKHIKVPFKNSHIVLGNSQLITILN